VRARRPSAGDLGRGGGGEPVDYLVWMRRLPAARMVPELLRADTVDPESIDALARALAAFHAAAPTGPEIAVHADPDHLRHRWDEEAGSIEAFVGRLLPAEDHEVLADFGPWFIRTH